MKLHLKAVTLLLLIYLLTQQPKRMGLRERLLFISFFLLIAFTSCVLVHGRPFFVFGSSYVDTGNVQRSDLKRPYPWKVPYGSTWPGRPSGRYSNGHVLTDILGTALKLAVPDSFSQCISGMKYPSGINFAAGGSGVLTAYGYPAASAQIESLQSFISTYTKEELASAVVLYATAGDDYLYYLTVQNAPLSDIYPLTVNVGKQIAADLVKLYGLGLRKFAVTLLPPVGCLPIATATSSFRSCNDSWNANVAMVHNARVMKNVYGLRHYFTNGTIVLLDLYSAFSSALTTFGSQQPLEPCCVGHILTNRCSSTDSAGRSLYSLCSNPTSKFFWDDIVHPTEAGWQSIVNKLLPSLSPLL